MPASPKKLAVGLLFDDTLDSNDGVSQQVKRLGEYLSRNGHRVVYLCGDTKMRQWSGGKVYSLSKNIKVRFNGNRLSTPIWSSSRRVKAILKSENIDVVSVTMPYSPFMAQKVIFEAVRQGIPVVGWFHILPSGPIATIGTRLLGLLEKRSLKKLSAVASTSASAAKFAKSTLGVSPVVVPNMVDISKLSAGINEPIINSRVVFLGRLVSRKGCLQLIRAFALLAEGEPDARLLVAGDGPDRDKLELAAHRLGISDKVEFLGFISEEDKPKILGSAQIACFPALYGESFGIVLIEAMAAGSEVVLAGDNPGYRCVMGDQPTLLVDPTDEKEFANRLALLLKSDNVRRGLHKWQLEHVKQYDVNVVGQQMLDIYDHVIALKHKSGNN